MALERRWAISACWGLDFYRKCEWILSKRVFANKIGKAEECANIETYFEEALDEYSTGDVVIEANEHNFFNIEGYE